MRPEAQEAIRVGDIAARAAAKIRDGWPLETKEIRNVIVAAIKEAKS